MNSNMETGVDIMKEFDEESIPALHDDLDMLKKLKRARELVFNPPQELAAVPG